MRILLAALVVSLTAVPALADPAPHKPLRYDANKTMKPAVGLDDSHTMVTDDCARARKAGKQCVLDMTGIDVETDHVTPTGIAIESRRFDPSGSLIRIRRDFIPEIVKTAEDL